MPITVQEITALETRINATLAKHNLRFVATGHFALSRINDPRNVPPIAIAEIESMLARLIAQHMAGVMALNDQDTFNLRCGNSHINIPCGFNRVTSGNGAYVYEIAAITVIRKQGFRSKDPYEFIVV